MVPASLLSFATATAILLAPSVAAISGNGKFSYYGDGGGDDQSPQRGLGSCGFAFNDVPDMYAALNGGQMNSGQCGKCIKACYQGRCQVFKIVDTCPGCPWGGVDVSHKGMGNMLGGYDAATNAGVIYGVQWDEVSCNELYGGGGSSPAPQPQQPAPQPQQPQQQTPHVVGAGNRCGAANGGNKCASGLCCSNWGWCGTTNDHCDAARGLCQSAYGACTNAPKPATTTARVSTQTQQSTAGTKKSGQTCGPTRGKCIKGLCCSKKGWCGNTVRYCSYDLCWRGYGECH